MPTFPAHPPVAPTYSTCYWETPLAVCVNAFFGAGSGNAINPATGTWCPPYDHTAGAEVPGYEDFTVECENCDGFGPFKNCHNPDFAAGVAYSEAHPGLDDLPTCGRGWFYIGCRDIGTANFLGPIYEGAWQGECPGCPSGYALHPDDCLCYSGTACPSGTCYCAGSGECVPCSEPTCVGVSNCTWDSTTCRYTCDGTPACGDREVYNLDTCACDPVCPEGTCYCEIDGTCKPCIPTEEQAEDGCTWNRDTCDFDCHDCPDGQCWCATSGMCVDCSDEPDCKEQLHCEWSTTLCDWVCDDPTVKCGGRAWLGPPDCRCEGGGGADLAELGVGWLVRAYAAGADIYVGTSRDAGATWEDVLVSSDGDITSAPALMVDNRDTVWVAWHKLGSDPFPTTTAVTSIYRSDDLGLTWAKVSTDADWTGSTYPSLCWTPERLLIVSIDAPNSQILHALTADGGSKDGAALAGAFAGAQENRAALRLDRRGLLHLALELTDGTVVHQWSGDGGENWSDPVNTLASGGTGADPSYALGIERGILAWWADGALTVATTTETGSEYKELVSVPTSTEYQAQQLGLLVDRRANAWILGMVDSLPAVTWSGNVYLEWREPV